MTPSENSKRRPSPSSSPTPTSLSPPSDKPLRKLASNVRFPHPPTLPSLTLRRAVSPSASVTTLTTTQPTDLFILAHGLQGTVEDFSYLLDELRESAAARNGRVLIHASRVNTDKTHDGVLYGGLRLAEDIRAVVAQYKTLRRIGLMGFSLGGLYVRYAIAVLYDSERGTIAGLQPSSLFIVAAPNLGVRSFGVYRFLPAPVLPMATAFFGETVMQMLLRDDRRLLLQMTSDRNSMGVKFISALKAFRSRTLYANVRNDFMVNYGTAALDHTVQVLGGPDVERIVGMRGALETAGVDDDYDDKGCRICFELKYEEEVKGEREDEEEEDEQVAEGEEEKVMSRRLKAVGWTVVGVDFPIAMPIAHNRIVAMSRNAMHTWMNAGGRRVVHHLVDAVLKECEEHSPRFQQVIGRVGGGRDLFKIGSLGRFGGGQHNGNNNTDLSNN